MFTLKHYVQNKHGKQSEGKGKTGKEKFRHEGFVGVSRIIIHSQLEFL